MKFKDLVEGKVYRVLNALYFSHYVVKDGLLCFDKTDKISAITFAEASELEFEEVIDYCDIHEAMDYMYTDQENECMFDGNRYCFNGTGIKVQRNDGLWGWAIMKPAMITEKKWVKL